ncbi:MAG: TonB-dependent receptor domain-containing protein [bacterium]
MLIGTTTFAFAPAAIAQESDDVAVVSEDDDATAVEDDDDADFVVTGSRIKKNTFNSIQPLQVIDAGDSLDVGSLDPASILQESVSAAGQQIDTSFAGFVLDNGPGSETLNLRGLGAGRTLLLINGRRMAPAGVEGAPTQPSLNLLPGSLVERYDLLLDGASSVYGSDAVAGVGNVILRQDFDGFEFFASGDYNQAGAGHDYTLNGAWGRNNDRGFIGIGVEYDYTDPVTFGDREFLAGCETHYEITESGEIRTRDLATGLQTRLDTQGLITAPESPCISGAGGFSGRIFERSGSLFFGSAYYTPGSGNVIPNFSDTGLFGVPIDRDGNGIVDIYFPDFSPGSRDLEQTLFAEQKQLSIMSYGEYTLEGDMNLTPYYELLHVKNEVEINSGQGVLFPDVPANNPYNICNPAAANGFDCGIGQTDLMSSPEYIAAFQAYYANPLANTYAFVGGDDNCFGLPLAFCTPATFGLLTGPVGAQIVSPQVSVRGDRNLTFVDLAQTRGVIGIGGDLPFLNGGSFNNWTFDTSLSYSYAEGDSSRPGIRDDRLALALGWDPTTDLDNDGVPDGDTLNGRFDLLTLPGGPCDVANVSNPGLLQPDAAAGCVPVNLFAPSLYAGLINGEFATQAERDYLFDTRDFNTVYEQTIFNAYATGEIYQLPAGVVSAVAGIEYRVDSLESNPDNVAADGLFFGFFVDQGAEGEKWTREAFFEVDVPLLANHPLAQELTANLSTRWTEDEFYGDDWTYSAKVGWRPIDSLLLKSSVGTSFRAPNLRENFIRGQSGFNGVFDPCAVQAGMIVFNSSPPPNFVVDPSLDTRAPEVIAACQREGRDPFSVGFDPVAGTTITNPGVEITTGGTDAIGPETSDSFTAGFSFEQPFFESFDLTIGASFYDIQIYDTIIEPSAQFLVNDCFTRTDGIRSAFCDRLSYNGSLSNISDIDNRFINQDEQTVSGIDYSLKFDKELTLFDRPVDFGLDVRANQLKERTTTFVDDQLNVSTSRFEGEFGFPEWTANATARFDFNDYRVSWNTRYIGEVEQDPAGIDAFSDPIDTQGTGFFGDTCLGPDFGDELCRDVGFADSYVEHDLGVRYQGDTWTVRAGITNVFDEVPPKVDGNEVFSISNTPIGNGYSLNGREYFISVNKALN